MLDAEAVEVNHISVFHHRDGSPRHVEAITIRDAFCNCSGVPGLNFQSSFAMTAAATMTRYGLGWTNGQYRGLRVVSHTGGTAGFAATIAFLPDADLGIVILSNSLSLAPIPLAFGFAVELRLFELLFDQPAEFDAEWTARAKELAAARPSPSLGQVEPQAVAPWLGRYDNAELGEVSLSLRGHRLVLDAGELNSELRPGARGGKRVYLLHDPPLSLFSQIYGATVTFTGSGQEPRMTIMVPASVTGPEHEFVFEPHR